MKFKPILTTLVTVALLGLIVVMAVLLSQVRQESPRFLAWPPTVLSQPCTAASLLLDQRLVIDRDISEVATTLVQVWREQGWLTEVDLRADGQAATLTARRGDQSPVQSSRFEAHLTLEDGTFHLLALGKHTCAPEDHK